MSWGPGDPAGESPGGESPGGESPAGESPGGPLKLSCLSRFPVIHRELEKPLHIERINVVDNVKLGTASVRDELFDFLLND